MISQVISIQRTNRPDPSLWRTQVHVACLPGCFVMGDKDVSYHKDFNNLGKMKSESFQSVHILNFAGTGGPIPRFFQHVEICLLTSLRLK